MNAPQSASATVVGIVTGRAELRFTASGRPVATFGVAVTEDHGRTSWFDVVAWNDLAEGTAVALRKGDHVVVHGQLVRRTWTANDGSKRSKVEIVADEIGVSLRVHRDKRAAGQQEATP